jgi:hypothetical protein
MFLSERLCWPLLMLSRFYRDRGVPVNNGTVVLMDMAR